jgi:hypothetical protein
MPVRHLIRGSADGQSAELDTVSLPLAVAIIVAINRDVSGKTREQQQREEVHPRQAEVCWWWGGGDIGGVCGVMCVCVV